MSPEETRWSDVFDAFREAAFLLDGAGIVVAANPAAVAWTGLPRETVIGTAFVELSTAVAPLRDHFRRLCRRPVRETLEIESEGSVLHLGIDPVPLPASPDRAADGGETALLCVLSDVTERKRMVQELKARNDALAEETQRKDVFLATLSHELRTPVGAITTAMHVLDRRATHGGDTERLREICRRQLDRLSHLLDDLLDISRVTRGSIALRREPANLGAVLFAAVEPLEGYYADLGHTLELDVPPVDVPVLVDRARLEQALGALLHNAAKFTPRGGHVQAGVMIERKEAVVRVRDDGIGIAPENLRRVFDLFVQVDSGSPGEIPASGLGVGLALARSIVQQHGGRVLARSAGKGRGCEFEIRLPLAEAAPLSRAARVAHATGRRRVLVVDDDEDARDEIRVVLEDLGHAVSDAASAAEAFALAAAGEHDLAFIDIVLPGMDGYSLAAGLRQLRGDDIVLAAITGNDRPEDRARALAAGFDVQVARPVSPESLARALDESPRRTKAAAGARSTKT